MSTWKSLSIPGHRWRGDAVGGLNAAIVAIPLAMAFGVESGLGASAGLVGAIVLGVIASMFGGTPLLISGPTGAMTVVSSLIIARELDQSENTGTALTTIFIIFLLAGALQIIFGLTRIGQYIRFVPYPIVSGFLNGIGLLMVIFQLLPLLGHPSTIHFSDIMSSLADVSADVNVMAVLLGLITILIIYLWPRITRKVPATFVALVAVSAFAAAFKLNVPTIQDLPDEWIKWRWSHLMDYQNTQWADVLLPAFTLAIIGSIDTLLTSMVVDMTTGASHDSNQELVGQGLGNMAAAVAGGIPGAGATMRTVLNVKSGAKTRLSVFIQSAVLLLVLLEIGFINYIPLSVLAAILITVGINTIDYKGFRQVFLASRSDGLVMITVMITVIIYGLPYAFGAGLLLSAILFVKKMSDQSVTRTNPILLKRDHSHGGRDYAAREVYIQQLNGPLFFGFAVHFREAIKALPEARAVIFRMERVPFVDHSGIVALREIIDHLKKRDIIILLTGMQTDVRQQLERTGLIPDMIPREWVLHSFAHAADWLEEYLDKNPDKKLENTGLNSDLRLDELKGRQN